MYDPLIINPTMTLGGKQAAFAASNSAMSLKLTHVSFGTGAYDPTGEEVALKEPVGSKISLAGGTRPTQYQIRLLAAWREDLGGETPITEIAYWAGNVLAFVWSNEDDVPAFTKTDGVPAVLFSDIAFDSVPAGSIDITVDPTESIALAALSAHEAASNAHPQYVEHALFPDAQADMWMTVTGSANALVLAPPTDVKVPAYKRGQAFRFQAAYSSTGPVSANINGLGAKAVVKSGGTVLAPGDLRVGAIYDLIYDGTRFQLAGGVGGGQFYVEWPTVATASQTTFAAVYTPGSEMVFVNGTKLAKEKYTATDGQSFVLETGVAAGALVVMTAFSTFAVADTYTKAEYNAFAASLAQAQNKAGNVLDRWMSPQRTHDAITARLQASFYDGAAGGLLVPGSFGLGATALAAATNLNTLTVTGTYGWGASTVGRPAEGEYGEAIHMTGDTAEYATQIVTSHFSGRTWLRRKNKNVWQTVEIYHSGNQLSLGTTAEDGRNALELGTAARGTLTVSNRDSTIGRVMRVGDFGLGTVDLTDLVIDLNTLTSTGFYLYTSGSSNGPAGFNTGKVIVMTNAQLYTQQICMPQSTSRMFQRSSNNGTWTPWTEVWNSNNLVKTENNFDTTIGRMLKVGDFGLGTKNLLTNNVIDTIDDPALGNGMYAVSNITTGTKPSTYGILVQEGRQNMAGTQSRVSQRFIDVDQPTPRIFHRVYIGATSSWSEWFEVWTSANLVKTGGPLDATVGRMLQVGDFGLGTGSQTSLAPLITDLNSAVLTGFFRVAASPLNAPAEVTQGATLIVVAWNNQTINQIAIQNGKLWQRQLSGGKWFAWYENWNTGSLEKTTSALDTTTGRMMKVGDFGIGGIGGVKYTFSTDADWAKPAGWSGFIDLAASKANNVTVPVATNGSTPGYGMWTIMGRRDTLNGYTGLLSDYASGRMWIGAGASGTAAPVFREIFSQNSVTAFAQSLLDDATMAEAQATLGISAMINGITTKDVSGKANVTLTAAEANVGVLWFTGTLTGNISVIVPVGASKWTVYNRTTGNFTLTLKTATGVGQLIAQGRQSDMVNGGTNMYFGANAFSDGYFYSEITQVGPNGFRLVDPNGKYGAFWRNDGGLLYLMFTELNDPAGTWSALRPIVVSPITGEVSLNNGANTAAPAFRESSTKVPNASWVQNELALWSRKFIGVGIGIAGNATLTLEQLGQWLNVTGAGSTLTLPASATAQSGETYLIRNSSSGEISITHPNLVIIQEYGVTNTTLKLKQNEWVELAASGTSWWIADRGKLEEVASMAQLGDRVGECTHFAGSTPPAGFLVRNGAAVSRTTYAALYAKIGTTYGAGDGSTTFNLPDSRGSFDRGWDNGRGLDTGRAFGSTQTSANLAHRHSSTLSQNGAHTHTTTVALDRGPGDPGNAVFGDENYYGTTNLGTNSAGTHSHTVFMEDSGENESRPHNVAFLPCIKF